MKIIPHTDMRKHAMPINPWPRWCFELWAMGCCDRIATHDYAEDFADVPRWRRAMWRLRGPLLERMFIHLWWWV